MKTYRKKPVCIQAIQWTPELDEALWHYEDDGKVHPFLAAFPDGVSIAETQCNTNALIYNLQTPEGRHVLKFGDWIARGTKGEYYVIPGDVFPTIYDEVRQAELDEIFQDAVKRHGRTFDLLIHDCEAAGE